MEDIDEYGTEWKSASGLARLMLRLAAVAALIWSLFCAFDYLMINTRNVDYIDELHPAAIQFLDVLPYDVTAVWGLDIAAVGLGSLLLLARSRFATIALAVSLIALVYVYFRQSALDMPAGAELVGFPAGPPIGWAMAIGLPIYGVLCDRRGFLR